MNSQKQTANLSTKDTMIFLGWLSIVLVLVSPAAAFTSARRMKVTLPPDQITGTRARALISHRGTSLSTRLQYNQGSDETYASSRFGWLNTIFTSSQHEQDDEQQFVDEYLEFLDRRYRRLHTTEEEQTHKAFNALNWLKQGSPSRNDVIVTQQQHEDALYVLGVAGLASRKLLQKHHLHVETDHTIVAENKPAIEFVDADITPSGPVRVLVKRILVPLISVLYIAHRSKEVVVGNQMRHMRKLVDSALRNAANAVSKGPVNAVKAVLKFGGGTKTMAVTFATLATMLLILRPILKTLMAEGVVRP